MGALSIVMGVLKIQALPCTVYYPKSSQRFLDPRSPEQSPACMERFVGAEALSF